MQGMPGQGKIHVHSRHLVALRDLLDLPFNTLQGDELAFLLAERRVIVRRIGEKHLSLMFELGSSNTLTARKWHALASRAAAAYDHAFPVSLIVIDEKLVFAWTCGADIEIDAWVRSAEDALTWAFDTQARFIEHS